MRITKIRLYRILIKYEQFLILAYTIKWTILSLIIALLAGSASAFFLLALDKVTDWRETHSWIIALLPLGGLLSGLLYYYFGKRSEGGNNILLEEIHKPEKLIDFRMAPLILTGTLITHLFGGSAGREGTAVQMGGSLADQLNRIMRFTSSDRVVIIICGISAGFASVFGTPLAGAVFGLEVFVTGRVRYNALFPAFLSGIMADVVCDAWGVVHTEYMVSQIPSVSPEAILYAIPAGIFFGLTALFYTRLTTRISRLFKKHVLYLPLRPVIGGAIVAAGVFVLGTTKYVGLGIPAIVSSFEQPMPSYDFLIKIIFTAVTIGAAFKGGEVTPLFFIGALLGNSLSSVIPLPLPLMAAMGFVAVFAGAANTPLATTVMAAELFGIQAAVYCGIACVLAYLFSGNSGIYSSQMIVESKSGRPLGKEHHRQD